MEEELELRIPPEIYRFFNNPGGHSLILRGSAGTGKTTFALQTIEDLSAVKNSYYLSTRVSDASLLDQFPWLGDKVEFSADDSTEEGGPRGGKENLRKRLNRLKGLEEESTPSDSEISLSFGKDLGEIETIYDLVEESYPEVSFIVIDSIDALAGKYDLQCTELINMLQKDLVEGLGVNVLFVLESPDPQFDYLGDGVVKLETDDYMRRRIREVNILKLRGCEIQQPRYLFTLKGGRLNSFKYDVESDLVIPDSWPTIDDVGDKVSTGIADLDRLLGDGLERGTIALIELGEGIPTSIIRAIETSLAINFITLGRGTLWIPSRKESPEGAISLIRRALNENDLKDLIRIPVTAHQLAGGDHEYILPVEGEDASLDLKWKNIEYTFQKADDPVLSLMGFDTVESIYGPDLVDQLMGYLAATKRNRGIFVAITSPSTRSTERLADIANVRLKIDRIGGTIIVYGKEPFTECNAVSLNSLEEGGRVSLTPIV